MRPLVKARAGPDKSRRRLALEEDSRLVGAGGPSSARRRLLWARPALAPLLLTACARAASAEVSCGSHTASSCKDCNFGEPDGEMYCRGECRWSLRRCTTKDQAEEEEKGGTVKGFPFPPDTRPVGCRDITSDLSNLTVSIVIPWLKEKWEHMEGTMHALLYFTPSHMIEEIIFVSDGNPDTREKQLKAISDKVKVIALPTRQGLIRAKMRGVAEARAPVLVFLESHIIVNRDWLPPLLDRVRLNPHVLAMPTLDYIPDTDWTLYFASSPGHWRYEWNFNLIYTNPAGIIQSSMSEPFESPGTSGGIFAMRKDWFNKLGLFDPEMYEWGGDHFELTMKVWRCGGKIEIVPCSRIGHLFREVKTRPYDVSEWQVVHNYARLAQVWTSDHLKLFYRVKPQARFMWLGDQSAQFKLRDDLKCKSMDWYLDNVDHEMKWEAERLCIWTWNPVHMFNWCKNKPPDGRSTVDHTMPDDEYLIAYQAARARAAEEAAAAAAAAASAALAAATDPSLHEL